MAGTSPSGKGRIVDINVTPLVDVVLVLLIVFMVTAQLMIAPSIPVKLPKASTGEQTKSTSIAITLKKDSQAASVQYYLNGGKALTRSQIRSKIVALATRIQRENKARKQSKKKLQAIVSIDHTVMFGKVVWLLDLLRKLNIEDYAFNIDPQTDTTTP